MSRKRRNRNDDIKERESKTEERPPKRTRIVSSSNNISSNNDRRDELKLCIHEYNKIGNKIAEYERKIKELKAKLGEQAKKYEQLKGRHNDAHCVECFALSNSRNKTRFDKCHECELLYCAAHLNYCEDCDHGFCDKRECNTLTKRDCGIMTCDECVDDPYAHPDCDACCGW